MSLGRGSRPKPRLGREALLIHVGLLPLQIGLGSGLLRDRLRLEGSNILRGLRGVRFMGGFTATAHVRSGRFKARRG